MWAMHKSTKALSRAKTHTHTLSQRCSVRRLHLIDLAWCRRLCVSVCTRAPTYKINWSKTEKGHRRMSFVGENIANGIKYMYIRRQWRQPRLVSSNEGSFTFVNIIVDLFLSGALQRIRERKQSETRRQRHYDINERCVAIIKTRWTRRPCNYR